MTFSQKAEELGMQWDTCASCRGDGTVVTVEPKHHPQCTDTTCDPGCPVPGFVEQECPECGGTGLVPLT